VAALKWPVGVRLAVLHAGKACGFVAIAHVN
jgi:hypothetical protein